MEWNPSSAPVSHRRSFPDNISRIAGSKSSAPQGPDIPCAIGEIDKPTVLKAPICLALSGNMLCELTTDRPHNNSVAGLPRHNLPAALPPDENWGRELHPSSQGSLTTDIKSGGVDIALSLSHYLVIFAR